MHTRCILTMEYSQETMDEAYKNYFDDGAMFDEIYGNE